MIFDNNYIEVQWNLYKRTLSTADTSHKRTKNIFPNELGTFLITSTLPRADTSRERTADKIFVQKCTKISKFTSISGQNKNKCVDTAENSETVSKKRLFCTVIRRIRIFLRILMIPIIFLAIQEG